jgi:ribosomal protein S18 acetylase RimI-like enzyme
VEKIAEINDSKTITDILNKAFMTVAQQYHFTKENAPRYPAFIGFDVIEKQLIMGFKMYGYAINDQTVGCIGYWNDPDNLYHIERLATLPEHRHLGIGKKLMEFAENKIMEDGGKLIEIHVLDLNTVLIEWYSKLKYVKIRIDELKHLPFNSYVMQKTVIPG